MKIKSGYAVRKVADTGVVVALEEMDCNHLMTLNQSGIDLWQLLEKETTVEILVQEMLAKYEVAEEILRADIQIFLDKIREAGLLDE